MSGYQLLASAWDLRPTVVVGSIGLLAAYAFAVRFRFAGRALAWLGGVLLILAALVSPLDRLADQYLFCAHMAKHILLLLLAPAMLLIGIPPDLAERLPRNRAMAHIERVLRRPAIAWLAGIGAMAFWHIPPVFNAAMESERLHIAENLSLLICGTIYWWPILSPNRSSRISPVPHGVAYLISSCLACTSIGIVITFAPRLLYPAYAQAADPFGAWLLIHDQWGISPALDQQIGGLLMWVPCCLVYLSATMAMFERWYAEERAVLVEA